MERFLIRIKQWADRDLNEFVKWIIILGIYGFFRMLAAVYDEKQLDFLILPLFFIGFNVLVIHWTLHHEIQFLELFYKKNTKTSNHLISLVVVLLFFAAIVFLSLFYYNSQYIMVKAGLISLLSFGLISMEYPVRDRLRNKAWLRALSFLLIIIWTASFVYDTRKGMDEFNELHFISYLGFLVYYFSYISLYRKPTKTKDSN